MKKEQVFWGALFILSGIFLVVSKLGFFPSINPLSFILSIFLVAIIIKSIPSLNFGGILFPIAFICILYAEAWGITAITPWTVLLAALLGTIGLTMIFHQKHAEKWNYKHEWDESGFETIDVEDEGHVRFGTSFGSSIKYINTDQFVQGDFQCKFGAMQVYFDHAQMAGDHATVRIDASFCGMELYVPRNWQVEDKVNTSFGAIETKRRGTSEKTHTLTLVGNVHFSGVEIIYI